MMADFQPPGRVFVVIEETVAALHGGCIPPMLGGRLVLPSLGEQLKQAVWLNWVLNFFYAAKVTRGDWVLAMGGGALTDLVNFAASVYKRGVKTALAPTTLLGQVDAAIGGKCGMNWRGVKNILGNFAFPARVFCAADLLDTLPRRQYWAGLAEVYKYQLLQLGPCSGAFRPISRGELPRQIEACCRYKDSLVARDPYDTGARMVLNLGHTLAHALEAVDGRFLHGEAVAWGLEYALRVAAGRGHFPLDAVKQELAVLRALPRPGLSGLDFAGIFRAMTWDKKNAHGRVNLILPGAGKYELVSCPRKELEEHWNTLANTGQ